MPCGPCKKSRKVCISYQRDRQFKNLSSLDHDSILARSQPLVPNTKPSFIQCELRTYAPSIFISKEKINPGSAIPISNARIFACFVEEHMPLKAHMLCVIIYLQCGGKIRYYIVRRFNDNVLINTVSSNLERCHTRRLYYGRTLLGTLCSLNYHLPSLRLRR